jgi:hypothetical protein
LRRPSSSASVSARLASTNTRLSWPSSDVSATACGDGSPPADCASAMLSIAASARNGNRRMPARTLGGGNASVNDAHVAR